MNQEDQKQQYIKGDSLKRGFKAFAERKASECRKLLNLKPHEHLNAFKLSEQLEVELYIPANFPLLITEIHALVNGGFSALTMKNHVDQQIIIHNDSHSDARQQSNVMHELAHIICEHPLDETANDYGNLPLRNYNKIHEDEAGWLGACLQLPRPALTWAMYRQMTAEQICDFYKVSKSMFQYRMNITGVARQFTKRSK
jgi:Zn-dependent peptidase ImmA (M78 family)